jgi:tRNA G18 (ribose-2'-O)-methylase SpoU
MPDLLDARKLGNREIEMLHASRTAPSALAECIVWLHNIRSMHNVGSVFRTCDAFGIGTVALSGFTPAPPRPEISKAALGADAFVSWIHEENAENMLNRLRVAKYTLCAIEQTTASKPIFALRSINTPAQKICFLFGNEVNGVDEALIREAEHVFEIPQFGKKHSLNVSVSAGVVLFQYLSSLLPIEATP